MIETMIKRLSNELEMTLEGKKGAFAFPLDDETDIIIEEIDDGIVLACSLGRCPDMNEEKMYAQMLTGNLFGEGTEKALLGLSDDGTKAVLSKLLDFNTTYEEFKLALEDFLNAADFWKEEVASFKEV